MDAPIGDNSSGENAVYTVAGFKNIETPTPIPSKKVSSKMRGLLNRVFEADCLEKMQDIPDKSVDMILCDLPYGMTQNAWDSYIPLEQLWAQYLRIIKPNGAIALTSHGIFTAKLILSQEKLFKYKWVWEKSKPTNFLNAKKQPLRKHEDVCVFYQQQPVYNPQMRQGEAYDKGVRKNQLSGSYGEFDPVHVHSNGQRYPTDIIYVKTAESEGEVVHPTQKPVELGRYFVRTYTQPGDVILDNTCGSGSFLVAALLEGRNFIGIEKNEDVALFKRKDVSYIDVCIQRLRKAWLSLPPEKRQTVYKSTLIKSFAEERSMSTARKVNNERSEAIELIKVMDAAAKRATWVIKAVGGESTLNTGSRRMFPDVFIFGDIARTQVLHGWEIKMPDVAITDSEFIQDAKRKADVLKVNSCFIWNFTHGVLYVKQDKRWKKKKTWSLPHIKTRTDVEYYKADWEKAVQEILVELNGFFLSGELRPASIGDIVSDTAFAAIISRNKDLVAEELRSAAASNTRIDAYLSQWWKYAKLEYRFDERNKYSAYAKYVLLNWVNKFTFANILKAQHNPALAVEGISFTTTLAEAEAIFETITRECGFSNIFAGVEYADVLPAATWADLTDFNAFLVENGIDSISQEALQAVLEGSVQQFKRNIVGQFTTPKRLARILVRAGVDNLTTPAIDPCCGTGTIAKAVLEEKIAATNIETAYKTTYAADKEAFPLQISNLSLTRADATYQPTLLFQQNAFSLVVGDTIQIRNPVNGKMENRTLPAWGSVVSNLPFVSFDQKGAYIEKENRKAALARVRQDTAIKIPDRADLYQALLLHMWYTMADGASIAVITSNSWLGTAAGAFFSRALRFYYNVRAVIGSSAGKWFESTDVVAVMLFLEKKPCIQPPDGSHTTAYGFITKPLDAITNDEADEIADAIKLHSPLDENLLRLRTRTQAEAERLLGLNIATNALFYDVDWLCEIEGRLCPVTDLFEVIRGIKTGQDPIYYLENKTDVDAPYLGRVLKNGREVSTLVAEADTDAFVCDKTLGELEALGHYKTLEWIDKFKGHLNTSVPNKETFWMNMSAGRLSGSTPIRLFVPMNPDRRFFYGLLKEPTVTNQRVVGFTPLDSSLDLSICHALLNTILGAFYTEANGFPRGLGVLDTSKDNMARVRMLDPRRLSGAQTEQILQAFAPLLSRKILPFEEELRQADRLHFEHTVLSCYGIDRYFDRIKDALLEMQRVRLSVKTKNRVRQ